MHREGNTIGGLGDAEGKPPMAWSCLGALPLLHHPAESRAAGQELTTGGKASHTGLPAQTPDTWLLLASAATAEPEALSPASGEEIYDLTGSFLLFPHICVAGVCGGRGAGLTQGRPGALCQAPPPACLALYKCSRVSGKESSGSQGSGGASPAARRLESDSQVSESSVTPWLCAVIASE